MLTFRQLKFLHKAAAHILVRVNVKLLELLAIDKNLPLPGLFLRTAPFALKRVGHFQFILAARINAAFRRHDLLLIHFHEPRRLASSPVFETPGIDIDGLRLSRILRHGHDGDLPGRTEILFHQERRNREHISDGIKSKPRIVGREIIIRVKPHSHNIRDGILILLAIHAPDRHATRVGIFGIQFENPLLNPGNDFLPFLRARLKLLFRRRHEVRADILPDPQPRQLII